MSCMLCVVQTLVYQTVRVWFYFDVRVYAWLADLVGCIEFHGGLLGVTLITLSFCVA